MTRSVFSFLLALLLAACEQGPSVERHAFFALGTLVEITVFEPAANIDIALHAAEKSLLANEQRWRAFGEGDLAAINARLATGNNVSLPPEISAGVHRAQQLADLSDGHFNPAIGGLVKTWQFHVEERPNAPPPSDAMIAAFLPAPRMEALQVDENGSWHSDDPRLWLDMGAFAKGLAVEQAINVLREHGVANAIVNAGGDLKAIGRHGKRAWRIGVRHPRGEGVLAALELHDNESVFTSGDYERFFEWQGERYHHILDSSTGRPARGIISVTIIHSDAALADAAATALLVAGPGGWTAIARKMGVDKVMVVLDDGSIVTTSSMQQRTTVEGEEHAPRVVSL